MPRRVGGVLGGIYTAHDASLIHQKISQNNWLSDQPGATEVVVVVVEVVVVVVVVLVVVVVGATVVVVVGATVVVVVVVEVVVVVGGGITNPFAQPQRISIGAPSGMPAVAGIASRARRNCAHASHAEIPVVGQPPFTWVHAAV